MARRVGLIFIGLANRVPLLLPLSMPTTSSPTSLSGLGSLA